MIGDKKQRCVVICYIGSNTRKVEGDGDVPFQNRSRRNRRSKSREELLNSQLEQETDRVGIIQVSVIGDELNSDCFGDKSDTVD